MALFSAHATDIRIHSGEFEVLSSENVIDIADGGSYPKFKSSLRCSISAISKRRTASGIIFIKYQAIVYLVSNSDSLSAELDAHFATDPDSQGNANIIEAITFESKSDAEIDKLVQSTVYSAFKSFIDVCKFNNIPVTDAGIYDEVEFNAKAKLSSYTLKAPSHIPLIFKPLYFQSFNKPLNPSNNIVRSTVSTFGIISGRVDIREMAESLYMSIWVNSNTNKVHSIIPDPNYTTIPLSTSFDAYNTHQQYKGLNSLIVTIEQNSAYIDKFRALGLDSLGSQLVVSIIEDVFGDTKLIIRDLDDMSKSSISHRMSKTQDMATFLNSIINECNIEGISVFHIIYCDRESHDFYEIMAQYPYSPTKSQYAPAVFLSYARHDLTYSHTAHVNLGLEEFQS